MHSRTNTFPHHPPQPPRHNHAQRATVLTLGPAVVPQPARIPARRSNVFVSRSSVPCSRAVCPNRPVPHYTACGVTVLTRRTCEPCFCTTHHSSFTTSSSVTPAPKPFPCSATRRGTEWQ